ncbi:MAG TPA: nitrate reductase molybdenum cofactor assembly chaperone [Solirubrobacteraceae bacterium]|nr:nitrate reductase molybdenum cofactor assembly chaperone [Solirubrobacteraceae bacterium]
MSNDTLRLAALLLDYPDRELYAATGELAQAASGLPARAGGEELQAFLAHRAAVGELVAQEEYVATFDFHKRASLHLSYYRDGDRRQRGMTLLGLKRRIRDAGLELRGGELPDYLPALLELAALVPREAEPVLRRFRAAIELLRVSLRDMDSPYAGVLDAVARVLPAMSAGELAEARRIAAEGPPDEKVGLEPFAPPEVMPYAEVGR